MDIHTSLHVFRKPPDHLSLLQVWDILETELSPTAIQAVNILDKGDLKDSSLHRDVVWSAAAIQEFQDLLDLILPKRGRFFNVHYLFFESLSALRESVLSGLNGQFHASLAVLRASLETYTFHLWWQQRLKFEDSFETFYDWLFGSKNSPPFRNVIDSVFEQVELPPSGSTKETFDAVYANLCAYAHKPLIDQAVTVRKGTNLTIMNSEILYFWLDLLQRTHKVILDLAIYASPMALFPVPIHTKFGFGGPLGVFFDDQNHFVLKQALGSDRTEAYRQFYESREPVATLLPWFSEFPDKNEAEILASWSGDQPLGHEHESFEERVFHGMSFQKAKMRSLIRIFSYHPDSPAIESLFQPPTG